MDRKHADRKSAGLTAYYIFGYHGGHFIMNHKRNAESIRLLSRQAKRYGKVVFNMDFEPYTLDRMANGANLDVERIPRHWQPSIDGRARLQVSKQAGRGKATGLRVQLVQGRFAGLEMGILRIFLGLLKAIFAGRAALVSENPALRHQLGVLQRSRDSLERHLAAVANATVSSRGTPGMAWTT